MARRADGRVKGQRRTSTQKCSVIESGSGYGKVVLPRMSKQPQRLWVYGVRKPKVVCLCAAMPMHGSAHCETMYNGRWTADRTHVAWVTCVEKGGQACITSYVCCPVLDNWLQKSNQIDWIIPMDHPYGWTVVDTTSLYSNKTTLNSLLHRAMARLLRQARSALGDPSCDHYLR